MRKIVVTFVLIVSVFGATALRAQQLPTKIGAFDENSVLLLVPGIREKLDSALRILGDSLKTAYDYSYSEYNRKVASLKDSGTMNKSVLELLKKDILSLQSSLTNWQQTQNTAAEQKQAAVLHPDLLKIYEALQNIVAEEKYTIVLKNDALILPVPLRDNLSIKVAKKLDLKLPAEVEVALKEDAATAKPKQAGASGRK